MKSFILKKLVAYKKYGKTLRRKPLAVVSLFVYAIVFTSVLAAGFGVITPAQATVTKMINFQGKLTNNDASGTNVANGTYSFRFKMYTALSGGSPVWTETWDGSSGPCPQITVTNGVFNAKLGNCNSSFPDFTGGSMYISVDFNPGAGYDGEMSPRKQIGATVYALVANGVSGDGTVQNTVSSATALTVAKAGTDYALQVDTATASAVTGLKVTSAAASGGLALSTISTAVAENLTIDAKGTGTISLGATSTGNLILGGATGDILIGGGSGSTGCTVTNSTGALACTAGGSFTTLGLTGAITGATGFNGLVITANTGVVTTGTWNATAIGSQYGGTGLNTSASTGVPSISSGTWSVNAQLPVSLGGSGTGTFTANGVLYGNTTSAFGVTAQGGANTVLVANAGAPSFSSAITVGTSISSPSVTASTSLTTPSIITASGDLGITPAAGSNLNITLATTGDLAVNTNQLYVDTSAGYVGLGTTTPNTQLELKGTSFSGTLPTDSGVLGTALTLNNGTGRGTIANVIYGGESSFEFVPNVSKGLGGLRIGNFNILGTGDEFFQLSPTNGTTGYAYFEGYTGAGLVLGTGTAAPLLFRPNRTTAMTILSGGNVGIGDTTPAALLTVGSGDLFQVNSSGAIIASTGYIQGSGTMSVTSANTTQVTTASALALNVNSLTTGTGEYIASSTLSSGILLDLAVTGTAGLTNQKGINVSLSGANGTGAQTTYGGYFSNTHTGTSNNVGLYATASGGTNNYAAIFEAGNVGIGTTTPTAPLTISGSSPEIRLQAGDYSRITRSATDNTVAWYNRVTTASTPLIGVGVSGAASQYLISNTSGTAVSGLTISFWVKRGASASTKGLMQWANSLSSGAPFVYLRDASGTLTWYVNGGFNLAGGTLTDDAWTHIAVTWDGSVWRSYKNGSEVTNFSAGGGNQANAASLYFGQGYDGYWTGVFDEIRAYNTALSAATITGHYNSGVGTYGSAADANIIGGWHLDENTGTNADDFTAASNNMTLTSGASWTTGIVGTGAASEATILTMSDNINAGEVGLLTVGHVTSRTVLEGALHIFNIQGVEKMRLADNGNLGIGDTTPASMLTVGSGDLFQVNSSGAIIASTGYIQGSGTMSVTSANTTQVTTASALALNASSLTTGTGLYVASGTLTSGSLVDLQVSGNAGASSQKVINVATTGTITGTQTTYGGYFANTHSGGTSTNVGLYVTATGGTNNYAAIFDQGNVGIGTAAPVDPFSIGTAINASATHALFNLSNTALVGGSASGTYIGANPAAFTGNFFDFQLAGASKARLTSAGAFTLNGVSVPTNSVGANIITKSDGTNLVASRLSDDGTLIQILADNADDSGVVRLRGGFGSTQTFVSIASTNDSGFEVDSNKIMLMSPDGGAITLDSGAGTTTIGDVNGSTNSTILTVSDADQHINIDAAQGLDVTQNTNVNSDTRGIGSFNSVNQGTILDGTRTLESVHTNLQPTALLTTSSGGATLNLYGTNQTVNAGTAVTLGDVGSDPTSLNVYGNSSSLLIAPIINDTVGNSDTEILAIGQRVTITGSPTYTNVAGGAGISTYAVFGDNGSASPGNSSVSYTSTGVYGASYGNLTTTGTTSHVGGLFATNGSALDSYGIKVFAAGATNNYGIYIASPTVASTNYAIYSASGAQSYFAGKVGIGDTSPASALTVGNGDLFQVNSSGAIAAVAGYIQGSGTMSVTSANTTQVTTASALALNVNSLTTGTGLYVASSTLSTGSLVDLQVSGTAGASSQKVINVATAGAVTGAQTTYGGYFSNIHTGASATNVGLYATASGATTGNYAAIFDQGNVGIGTTTPTAKVDIVATYATTGFPLSVKNTGYYQAYFQGTNASNQTSFYIENDRGSFTSYGGFLYGGSSSSLGNLFGQTRTDKLFMFSDGASSLGYWVGTLNAAPFVIGTNNSERIRVLSTGNVGIGDTTPAAMFTVGNGDLFQVNSSGAIAAVVGITNTGSLNTALGSTASTNAVCSSLANTTAPTAGVAYELRDCNAAPAADYAENYPVAAGSEYGDLMAVGTEMVSTYDTTNGIVDWTKVKGNITKLVKTSGGYQPTAIGVVSDNYGDFTSAGHNIKSQDNPMPIALVGRVIVKVTTENGAIVPGDFLTSSATVPGAAMKATKAGPVIGQALDSYNASGTGKILVFIKVTNYNGVDIQNELPGLVFNYANQTQADLTSTQILEHLLAQLPTLDPHNLSQIHTDVVIANGEVVTPTVTTHALRADILSAATAEGGLVVSSSTVFNGGLMVDSIGSIGTVLSIKNDVEFFGTPYFTIDTAGFAVAKAGVQSVDVTFTHEYLAQPIVSASISFEQNTEQTLLDIATRTVLKDTAVADAQTFLSNGVSYVITNKSKYGFTIVLNKPAPSDIKFSWIALAVRNATTFMSLDAPVTAAVVTPNSGTVAGSTDPATNDALTPTSPTLPDDVIAPISPTDSISAP